MNTESNSHGTQIGFPDTPLLVRLEDEDTASSHYWWVVYRGQENPCLQLMLLHEDEAPEEAKLKSLSGSKRRSRISLEIRERTLLATPKTQLANSVNGWTRWLAAMVLAWTTEFLPEVKTLRLIGLNAKERTRLFPPDGRLANIRQLTRSVRK